MKKIYRHKLKFLTTLENTKLLDSRDISYMFGYEELNKAPADFMSEFINELYTEAGWEFSSPDLLFLLAEEEGEHVTFWAISIRNGVVSMISWIAGAVPKNFTNRELVEEVCNKYLKNKGFGSCELSERSMSYKGFYSSASSGDQNEHYSAASIYKQEQICTFNIKNV